MDIKFKITELRVKLGKLKAIPSDKSYVFG